MQSENVRLRWKLLVQRLLQREPVAQDRRQPGRNLGEFGWIHAIACPSEDEIWVGELINWRVQKLVTKGKGGAKK